MSEPMTLEEMRRNVEQHRQWRIACVPRTPSIQELSEWVRSIDAHLAQPAQAVDVGACYSAVIKALAGIANCPQTDAQLHAEVIPRDPIMVQVMRIREAMDKLTRALSGEKAGPVDGWKPIETAPKDQSILVCPPLWNDHKCSIAHYDDDKYLRKPKPFWKRDDDLGQVSRSKACPPTHWMPLPDPPASPTPDKEGKV